MNVFSAVVLNSSDLRCFLSQAPVLDAVQAASNSLVQFYVGSSDVADVQCLAKVVAEIIPHAVVVGASSAGEICQGSVSQGTILVSVASFASSQLSSFGAPCSAGQEFEAGQSAGIAFKAIPHLRGILLLAPPTRLDCARILAGLQSVLPDITVFGGGAADSGHDRIPRVFLGTDVYESGVVAVALAGSDLWLEHHVISGWKALGPSMTLTDVRGFEVCSIDGRPAVEMYRRYLRIEPDDQDIFLLEFPLLIDRGGVPIARNPVAMHKDGSVELVADVRAGEIARLAYLDIDAVLARVRGLVAELELAGAEALFLYSCVCRRFTLQQDVEFETRPFRTIAPVSGFFTYGEFCRLGQQLQILNSSQVVVAMRESEARPVGRMTSEWARAEEDKYSFRHSRITSRLFALVSALTDELEQSNSLLRFLSEHDALTGALNRRSMDDNLATEWQRSHRYGYEFSVLMLDLDNFKRLNDEYGHAVGDSVLGQFGRVVQGSIRASDSFYRYGGEEFLVLLPETATVGALEVAEKIRAAVEFMHQDRGVALPAVTCSVGVACSPEDGAQVQTLLKEADRALYRAKAEGRNRIARSPFSAEHDRFGKN
ncbi:sensor domain-containing diguanylate cyclase [Methyloterricola oryzae]|uniref:sensor domain-containing diguanylate cyclase n=1 Tax=Methyloterricola oryzae TaxID=1495050 RepID=UPI0005EB3181|nr:diguanylate cyclase [Methyloterricola oryzae]